MIINGSLTYRSFLDYVKVEGVVSDYMSFYKFYSYTFPTSPNLVTANKDLDGFRFSGAKIAFRDKKEFDYENYLFNLTETIKCPEIERAFSDHLDDTDEDVLYHVMQTYRERAVRNQFDGNPAKFWEYDKKVVIPQKLIEVGDFYGTTDRLIFLWEDCWDI